MTTLPEPPRSPLVDAVTGRLTREWVRFFDDLRRAIVGSLDETISGRLDALEADALFGAGEGHIGTGSDYNDAAVRVRLDALETEVLFPSAGSDSRDLTALSVLVAALRLDVEARALESAFTGDGAALQAALSKRVEAIELAQALMPDVRPELAACERRLAVLEMADAFALTASARLEALWRRMAAAEGALTDLQTDSLF